MTSDPGESALSVYVIYKNPSDYPGRYVLRRQRAGAGGISVDKDPMYVGKSLKEAHEKLPLGLCMMPGIDPDPAIFQVWI